MNSSGDDEYINVQGKLTGQNASLGFISFDHPVECSAEIAIFRTHRIFIAGKKVKPAEVKTAARFKTFLDNHLKDMILSCDVRPMDRQDATFQTSDGSEVHPRFYAHSVWILGQEVPPEAERRPKMKEKTETKKENQPDKEQKQELQKQTSEEPMEDQPIESSDSRIEDREGTMVYRNLSNFGYISFMMDPADKDPTFAVFNMKQLYLNGAPIEKSEYGQWARDKPQPVHFNATLKQVTQKHVRMDSEGNVVSYDPRWRCTSVWIGAKPEASILKMAESESGGARKKGGVANSEDQFKALVKDCEYLCGRLNQFVDRSTGLIMSKDRAVLFKLSDLLIAGHPADQDSRLSSLLQIGETLFCFVKPLTPIRTFGDITCNSIAVQIWKGKRTAESNGNDNSSSRDDAMEMDEEKGMTVPIRHPSEATHCNVSGTVTEVEVHLAKARLDSDPSKRVLLSRRRIFINGQRLKFRDSLHEHLSIGDKVYFDMAEADKAFSDGEYEWMALLVWAKGNKPKPDEVELELSKRTEQSYRGKVFSLASPDATLGVTAEGLLTIIAGPNNVGEKVYFTRENFFVFGAGMAKSDLQYIIKDNDKVQLELETIDDPNLSSKLQERYGFVVQFRSTLTWLGPLPKLDELDHTQLPAKFPGDFPKFLEKRGMDLEFFTRMAMGELPPKNESGQNNNLSTGEKSGLGSSVAPESVIRAKAFELKKPSDPLAGTEHGIFIIESGPFAGEKAFFNRTSLWCYGHNMSKADLMYVINPQDIFTVEVQSGTNNKSIPLKITSAWIGDKVSNPGDPSSSFTTWLNTHDMTLQEFQACITGQMKIRPFFPLPLERQNARIVHMFPHTKSKLGQGIEYGILRVHQGSLAKKDVLFERDSVYLWGVNLSVGDMSYVLKESDKVFCEVSEIVGKEKKKWQTRLNMANIPKYNAVIVYVGGGRPKQHDTKLTEMDELIKNTNLTQWLMKRGVDLQTFKKLIDGQLPPKPLRPVIAPAKLNQPMEPFGTSFHKEASPLVRHNLKEIYPEPMSVPPPMEDNRFGRIPDMRRPSNNFESHPPPMRSMDHTLSPRLSERPPDHFRNHSEPPEPFPISRGPPPPPPPVDPNPDFSNPIMSQAKAMLSRVMTCTSPDDVIRVKEVVQSKSDVDLALFIAKTLEASVGIYKSKVESPGPIRRPQTKAPPPGPIAPPNRNQEQRWNRDGGLIGLDEPLLGYGQSSNRWGSEGARGSSWREDSAPIEPPFKRKFDHFI